MPKRNSKRFTEQAIKLMGKPPRGARVERFDSEVDGLCIRVTGAGTKSWYVYYRFPGPDGEPKHHRLCLGRWPETSVKRAREAAQEIKEQVASGTDPKRVLQLELSAAQAEAEKTFTWLAEKYIARECPNLQRGREIESLIRRELIPYWGWKHVTELRQEHLTEVTDRLIDAGKPMAALRLYEVAKRVLRWSLKRGHIEASPFAASEPPVARVKRGRVLKHHEIGVLWSAWDKMGYPYGPMMQFLLLTAQRRSEVAHMAWTEIDVDKLQWTIPEERSKSKREHIVPLSAPTMEIINAIPRIDGSDYVLTVTGERPVSAFSQAKAKADEISEISDWRLHDLRRTARTEMARLGVAEIVSERVLNHLPRGLVAVYNIYEYLDEKRDALERWGQELTNILTPPPENVVRLKAQQ